MADLSRLHRFIADHHDLDDLHTLCFNLGVDYKLLLGEGKTAQAWELILCAGRQRRLEQLLNTMNHSVRQ